MTVKVILKMGNPSLREKSEPIPPEEIQSAEISQLLQDMNDTMKEAGGIGIAAPQIGVNKQVAIIDVQIENERYKDDINETKRHIIFNPEIEIIDETLQGFTEGCLSVPGLVGFVERPRKVKIKYLDETAKPSEIITEDFLATVFQHELDHLFGILYVDHITNLSTLSYVDELERISNLNDS